VPAGVSGKLALEQRYPREKIKRRVSVNEALHERPRVVVLGDPGAGKTTLLKYVTLAFSQERSDKLDLSEERLPIFVRLYDFVARRAERQEDYSLVDYLYTQARENLLLDLQPGFFESEENLTQTLITEPRIRDLATDPLMLTIIALVHRIEAELPDKRVKLYDKCVTALVETWEKVKGSKVADRRRPYYRLRRRLLEGLAFRMHSQHARQVKAGDLELHLTRFLLENPKLHLDDEGARQEARDFVALAQARTACSSSGAWGFTPSPT
ncbi:MAG: NACHT domain-containing protein, partial [Anaerolineales bacterium]